MLKLDRQHEAAYLYESAVVAYRKILPVESVSIFSLGQSPSCDMLVLPPLLAVVEKLAEIRAAEGKMEETSVLCEEAVSLARKLHGKDHPCVAPRLRRQVCTVGS